LKLAKTKLHKSIG